MKFSIIVPVYNAEKYLDDAIESLLGQTYEDYEIILIDDGSTDSSANICDFYKSKYGEKIQVGHKQNEGQLLARCSGIEKAKGQYCLFLDADDILTKNSLTVISRITEQYHDPDLILFSFFYQKEDGTQKQAAFPLRDEEFFSGAGKRAICNLLFEGTAFNSMCMKAVRTEVVKNIQFEFEKYASLRSGEDRLQSMTVIDAAKTIVAIKEPLYIYRLAEGSVTRSFSIDTIERFNMRLLCRFEEEFLNRWGMNDKSHIEMLQAGFLNHVIYVFLKYYSEIQNRAEKRDLLHYDWSAFVEFDYLKNIEENPFVNAYYKKVWRCVITKQYKKIRLMLLKRAIYMKLRNWKRAVFNKEGK